MNISLGRSSGNLGQLSIIDMGDLRRLGTDYEKLNLFDF
jgi:hypothetical protein